MDELMEITLDVSNLLQQTFKKSVALVEKLTEGKEFSLDEVDDVIDTTGKYQAFVMCLRQYAKP